MDALQLKAADFKKTNTKDLNRYFSKEYKWPIKHMKRQVDRYSKTQKITDVVENGEKL